MSRVLDVGALDGGAPYMVMEYLEGTDLSDLLHKSGPIPVKDACEYILQACEAIAEAHGHGIVHRDLKPANLFLTKGQSGEPIVKVLDFGVSKVLDLGMEDDDTNPGGRSRDRPDSVVTKVSDLLGSPSYMAPEQIVSARDADVRSDIWSLGVILFRLISGKAPFHGASLGELIQGIMHGPIPNLRDVKPDLPPGLEIVVARCLERERDNRLGDVIELARMLAPFAGPVATPSLERIAILGPALVASVPPPAMPSGPSFSQSTNAGAWTSQPIHSTSQIPTAPGEPDKKEDLTAATAAIWAAVFVLFVAVTAIMVAKIAGQQHDAPPSEPAPTLAATPPSDPLPTAAPTALDPSLSVVPVAPVPPPPVGVASTAPVVSSQRPIPNPIPIPHSAGGHGGARRGGNPSRGTSGGSSGDIPATRE